MAEVQERASRALERIAMENDGKTVVVAAHAATIRAVQCLYEGKTLDEIGEIPWVSNASVTVFRYENGEMTVVWQVMTSICRIYVWSNRAHR